MLPPAFFSSFQAFELRHFNKRFSQTPPRPTVLYKSTIMIEICKQNLHLRLCVGQTIWKRKTRVHYLTRHACHLWSITIKKIDDLRLILLFCIMVHKFNTPVILKFSLVNFQLDNKGEKGSTGKWRHLRRDRAVYFTLPRPKHQCKTNSF